MNNSQINNIIDRASELQAKKLEKIAFLINLLVTICISLAFIYGYLILKNEIYFVLLFVFPLTAYAMYLAKIGSTIPSFSIMFFSTSALIAVFSVIQGEEAATHFHFVNTIIALSLLFGYDKAKKHFYYNLLFTIICIALVLLSFENDWFNQFRKTEFEIEGVRFLNYMLVIPVTIVYSFIVVQNSKTQQRELRYSLEEQKTLLAEVNHRVKNNMAIIISLLNLKRDMSTNTETHEALNDCKNRVMSMAIVHQKMYQSKSVNEVELSSYVSELTEEIKNSVNLKKKINVIYSIENIKLNVSVAIPLGLILNELITNSFKHAFDKTENPEITIKVNLLKNNMLELNYSDNGKGVENINEIKTETLGLILIDSLSGQIDGNYEFKNSSGLKFRLLFPIAK